MGHGKKGFNLVGLVVAMGIASLVMMGLMSAGRQASEQYRRISEREAAEDIRNIIRQLVLCPPTVAQAPPGGCLSNPEVSVYKGTTSSPSLLLSTGPGYTQFGQYEVRARCQDGGTQYTLKIDYRKKGESVWRENIFEDLPYSCPMP